MESEEKPVQMQVTPLGTRLTKIVLSGALDTPGVDHIEARFVATVVPGNMSAVVDVSRVEFIASMGIRMFISVARSLALRHAKLAVYGAQSMVGEVLENASLNDIVPVVASETDAIAAVSS
jgi:anti-sigma B factor antagonist